MSRCRKQSGEAAQLAFTRLTERVLAWHRQSRANALIIEGASIGRALYEQTRNARLPSIISCPTPRLSKLNRQANCKVRIQSGDFLPPGVRRLAASDVTPVSSSTWD